MFRLRYGCVVGVLALTSLASVSQPAASTSCAQWNVSGTWKVTQHASAISPLYHVTFRLTQSGKTVTGQGILTKAEAKASAYTGTVGKLKGTVSGSHLSLAVTWPPLTDGRVPKGTYVAAVSAGAMSGQAWAVTQPTVKIAWDARGQARCVR